MCININLIIIKIKQSRKNKFPVTISMIISTIDLIEGRKQISLKEGFQITTKVKMIILPSSNILTGLN